MKTAHANKSSEQQKGWLVIGAAIAGLTICTFLAANRQVSLLEGGVLDLVYSLPGPFTELMYVITQAGSVGAVMAVVVTAFVLKRRQLAALLLANSLAAYALTAVLKELIARPRPAEILPDILVRLEYASGFGFPSGHTAIATALALGLIPFTSRKYRWLLWLWIGTVASSRMYLGVHAPLDVIGGFCVGVIAVYGIRMATAPLSAGKSR